MFSFLQSPLKVGTRAPDFTAADQDGNSVQLGDLRGSPVLLVFYPGDDTPGCRRQFCGLQSGYEQLRKHNVRVFGVNPQSAASHRKFRDKYKYPFPFLVDTRQAIARRYRAHGFVVTRTVYLLDAEGNILLARRGNPSIEDILAAL
jgi:peroxiredoxin Q/BCP